MFNLNLISLQPSDYLHIILFMKNYFTVACIAASSVVYADYPPLNVKVDGVETTLYVQHPSWSTVSTDDKTLKYAFNNRMYLSTVK